MTSQREAGCHISIPVILCGELSLLQSYYWQVEYQSRKIKSFSHTVRISSTWTRTNYHPKHLSPPASQDDLVGDPEKNWSVTQKAPRFGKGDDSIGKSIKERNLGKSATHRNVHQTASPGHLFFWEYSRYSNPFLAAPKSVGLLGWIFTVPGLLRTWKASSLEEAARFWRLWESSLQR